MVNTKAHSGFLYTHSCGVWNISNFWKTCSQPMVKNAHLLLSITMLIYHKKMCPWKGSSHLGHFQCIFFSWYTTPCQISHSLIPCEYILQQSGHSLSHITCPMFVYTSGDTVSIQFLGVCGWLRGKVRTTEEGSEVCLPILNVSPQKGTVFNCVWRVCLFYFRWPPWVHADGALNSWGQQGSHQPPECLFILIVFLYFTGLFR